MDTHNRSRYSPIALFVYKRPTHAEKTLAHLAACVDFEKSQLFVFCDGPRTETDVAAVQQTRNLIKQSGLRNMTVIEHEKNLGLARSIIYGVTQLCQEHGSVIVIEDDLIVAPYFLTYMNLALKCFADRSEVMHISGYMYPVELESSTDALFLPFISSWGWATWQRAWQHFDPYMSSFDKLAGDAHLRRKFDLEGAYPFFRTIRRQREGKIDSWAIRWYLSVFMRQGVALYPTRSLVRNEGLDGSGTHWKARETALTGPLCMAPLTRLPETTTVDEQAYRRVVSFLRRYNHPLRKAWRRLRATVHLPAIQ